MKRNVLFLRGINVGGHGRLPMADLRAAIEDAGGSDPRTYIQSGNAVFGGAVSRVALLDAIEARAGFRPAVMLLTDAAFATIRAGNPFPDAVGDPKALHVGFLDSQATCNQADLDAAKGPEETVQLTTTAVYLHTPEHLTGSKLAPKLERLLGVPITFRNWRTVDAIATLLEVRA